MTDSEQLLSTYLRDPENESLRAALSDCLAADTLPVSIEIEVLAADPGASYRVGIQASLSPWGDDDGVFLTVTRDPSASLGHARDIERSHLPAWDAVGVRELLANSQILRPNQKRDIQPTRMTL